MRRIEEQDQLHLPLAGESYEVAQARALVPRHGRLLQARAVQYTCTAERLRTHRALHDCGKVRDHCIIGLTISLVAIEIPKPFWRHRRTLILQAHRLT